MSTFFNSKDLYDDLTSIETSCETVLEKIKKTDGKIYKPEERNEILEDIRSELEWASEKTYDLEVDDAEAEE